MISFIYEWLDLKTGLKYLGRHVGDLDDGYVGSGTAFIVEYKKRPSDFQRFILWQEPYTTDEIIKLKEEEFLALIPNNELYNGTNRRYYNQVKNSRGFTSQDNPMKDTVIVNRMIETQRINGNKDAYHNTITKYGKEEWARINSRNKLGNRHGSGNLGKPKSEEHKRKIAEAAKTQEKKNRNVGRGPTAPYAETLRIWEELGITNGSKYFDISEEAFKHRVYRARDQLTKTN